MKYAYIIILLLLPGYPSIALDIYPGVEWLLCRSDLIATGLIRNASPGPKESNDTTEILSLKITEVLTGEIVSSATEIVLDPGLFTEVVSHRPEKEKECVFFLKERDGYYILLEETKSLPPFYIHEEKVDGLYTSGFVQIGNIDSLKKVLKEVREKLNVLIGNDINALTERYLVRIPHTSDIYWNLHDKSKTVHANGFILSYGEPKHLLIPLFLKKEL